MIRVSLTDLFASITALLFIAYFAENVAAIGAGGTLNILLGVIFLLALYLFGSCIIRGTLFIRLELFAVILFLIWFFYRVHKDTGDSELLWSLSFGTTGGLITFYLLGIIIASCIRVRSGLRPTFTANIVFALLTAAFFYLWLEFVPRIRADIFYLDDINGEYQRAGNFLSIMFMVYSFCFFTLFNDGSLLWRSLKNISLLFLYALVTFSVVLLGQLIGSNSATGMTLGLGLITLLVVIGAPPKKNESKDEKDQFHEDAYLPFMLLRIVVFLFLSIYLLILILMLLELLLGLSPLGLNLFNFGGGEIPSLVSRLQLLNYSGLQQLSYAPILGNFGVAEEVTGEAGLFIHSFFPNIFSKLGGLGLLIMISIVIFTSCRQILALNARNTIGSNFGKKAQSGFSLFGFLYVLFFANLSTDVSWSVFWFSLGFLGQAIVIKD